ncbi:MAG: hypothetical protein M3O01_15680, partial [Pseudomonadota bacterium]|nr:hypothetical protein [Pseudomonadota bacterium]
MTLRILAVLALMCSCIGAAQADADNDRIAAERDAANARLSDQETRCNEQFVVSPCLEAARTAHRKTLHRLRLDELEVESKRRQVAADARRKQIAERALAQQ